MGDDGIREIIENIEIEDRGRAWTALDERSTTYVIVAVVRCNLHKQQMADSIQPRGPGGRLLPGNTLGVTGRPPGFAGLAKKIGKQTRDGDELIEWALSVFRDPAVPLNFRMEAFRWLSDRFYGKAPNTVVVETNARTSPHAFGQLTDDDLAEFERRFRAADERSRNVIDVPSVP